MEGMGSCSGCICGQRRDFAVRRSDARTRNETKKGNRKNLGCYSSRGKGGEVKK